MWRKKNPNSTPYVKPDYDSQNYETKNKEDSMNRKKQIKLRSSLDIYNRLMHDKTLNLNLKNVLIGYSDTVLGDQEKCILNWTMIDKGGDIPMHHILYFIFILNNGNKLILWDRKTKLDRLYCSGITKQHQSLISMLNSPQIQRIQSLSTNTNNNNNNTQQIDEKSKDETKVINHNHNHNSIALCKFYGAGYCYYGSRCNSLHDADAINTYEEQWLNCKIIINKQKLPLVALDSTFSKQRICKQKYDYILVLDLEGKDEIIELPCILIDLVSMMEISRFHCWIRPTKWDKGEIPKYKQNDKDFVNMKCNAVGFGKALQLLSEWLFKFGIYLNNKGEYIKNTKNELSKSFLCAICGNWDIKTQIPKQCKICNIDIPKYFNQWMNIKDFALGIYSNFEPYQVKGMFLLLKNLNMKLYGTHHLGMDDTYNIARIIIEFVMNNAVFDYTAYRDNYSGRVIYKNNNRRVSRYHTSKRPKNNYFQYRR